MAKVDLELVKMILHRNELDVRVVSQILNELEEEARIQDEIEDKPPQVKKQHVILVSDPAGELEGKDFTGWVVQIPEEDSPFVALERIFRGAYDFNASPKGRRMPVKKVGEACEVVSAKFFKEHKVFIKTKEPVLVVRTDNAIPTEKPGKHSDSATDDLS
ncbi:MAG: hypothetical protein JW706_09195 [Opitutales bacterium]|nr:hypothetical protein [Opitutales bacterium]